MLWLPLLTRYIGQFCTRKFWVHSHPTVGFALFGSNISERLSPSREELPVSNDNFTSKMGAVLADRRVDRVVRTNLFETFFRVR